MREILPPFRYRYRGFRYVRDAIQTRPLRRIRLHFRANTRKEAV